MDYIVHTVLQRDLFWCNLCCFEAKSALFAIYAILTQLCIFHVEKYFAKNLLHGKMTTMRVIVVRVRGEYPVSNCWEWCYIRFLKLTDFATINDKTGKPQEEAMWALRGPACHVLPPLYSSRTIKPTIPNSELTSAVTIVSQIFLKPPPFQSLSGLDMFSDRQGICFQSQQYW